MIDLLLAGPRGQTERHSACNGGRIFLRAKSCVICAATGGAGRRREASLSAREKHGSVSCAFSFFKKHPVRVRRTRFSRRFQEGETQITVCSRTALDWRIGLGEKRTIGF